MEIDNNEIENTQQLTFPTSNLGNDNNEEIENTQQSTSSTSTTKPTTKRKHRTSSDEESRPPSKYLVPTQNRYESVSDNESDPENEHNESPPNLNTKNQDTQPKVPPLFVHDADNYQELLTDLNEALLSDFTTQQKSNKVIKINCSSSDDYRNLAAYFSHKKIKYN